MENDQNLIIVISIGRNNSIYRVENDQNVIIV